MSPDYNLVIREGTPQDCSVIVELIKELAVFEREPESTVKVSKETLIRDGFGENKWFETLLAEIEIPPINQALPEEKNTQEANTLNIKKKIVGFAFFFPTYSTWKGRALKLEDLYVQPDYRGLGIGTKLLREVTRIALEKQCERLHWAVLDWNEPAIEFYRKIKTDISEEWNVCMLHKEGMENVLKTISS